VKWQKLTYFLCDYTVPNRYSKHNILPTSQTINPHHIKEKTMTERINSAAYLTDQYGDKSLSEFALQPAEQVVQLETDLVGPAATPDSFASPDCYDLPVYIRQVRQATLMEGLGRLLADIYGDRNETPITLSALLHKLGSKSEVVTALASTQGQPVANKLLDRLSHRLALTAEGQKQFQVLKLLYGLSGDQPRSTAEIAAIACLSSKDIRHLSIMMRCRLESEPIRSFVEDTLKLLVKEFAKSALCREITSNCGDNKIEVGPGEPDQRGALMDLEQLAEQLVANLEGAPTVNISGKAGTGKTSLALKVTTRLLQQGKRVLYVSHSRFFAQHIHNLTRFYPGDLTVSTFHALCHLYAREAGINIPAYRNNKVFNELFPELLIAAIHARSENAFDAIVVDEGHSLLPNFWRALKFCLKDLQRGAFFYFYDPVIINLAKNKTAPFAAHNVTLTSELRPNFRLAQIKGGLEVYEAVSREEASQAVSRVVADLLKAQVRPDEIVILAADAVPKVSDNRYNLPKGIKLAATPGNREKHILYTSLSSFRAMTKPVVILTLGREVEDLAQWKLKYLSYSAFSRAGQKLILIGNLKSIEKILPDGVRVVNPETYEAQLRRP
jgi:hypothetical protein